MQLVRSGILLTLIAYILMSLPNPSSTAPFLTGTLFLGLSGATTPALQSLALALASPRDAGKVLASLAVLSTLACQLVGPPIFGSVYIGSMDWWPEAVFSCACAWIVLSLVSTFFVKLVDDVVDVEEQRRRE